MSEKERATLLAALDAAKKVLRYSEDFSDGERFYQNEKSFDATLMNFVVMGECVSKLSDATILANPQVPWSKIKGLRNIVAHDYFGVDAEEVWQIIQKYIPMFLKDMEAILKQHSG